MKNAIRIGTAVALFFIGDWQVLAQEVPNLQLEHRTRRASPHFEQVPSNAQAPILPPRRAPDVKTGYVSLDSFIQLRNVSQSAVAKLEERISLLEQRIAKLEAEKQ